MAATFISVTLDDFEAQFNMPHKRDPNRRAFELTRPNNAEAYYTCIIREDNMGTLMLRVLTTCAAGHRKARGVGQDAIRCHLVWRDANGWEAVVGKTNRTYRSGGADSTASDIVKRTLDKCRIVAKESLRRCPKCGRPMMLRKVKSTDKEFWGCCAFKDEGCKGSINK